MDEDDEVRLFREGALSALRMVDRSLRKSVQEIKKLPPGCADTAVILTSFRSAVMELASQIESAQSEDDLRRAQFDLRYTFYPE